MKKNIVIFCIFFLLSTSLVFAAVEDEDEELLEEDAKTLRIPSPLKAVPKDVPHTIEPNENVETKAPQQETETPEDTQPPRPFFQPINKSNWWLEIFYVALIASYIVNYYNGKKKNDEIAKKWADTISRLLVSNFSKVGESADGGIGLIKESNNVYRLKATGRMNCIGLQLTLNLRKRHDIISILMEILWPVHDAVTVDVLMNEESMESFVFAILPKREERRYRKSAEDIAVFTKQSNRQVEGTNNLLVVTEVDELATDLLPNEVLSTLKSNEKDFLLLHFSDQGIASAKNKKSLHFQFKLDVNDMAKLKPLYQMVIFYIDLVSRTRLSKMGKTKVEQHRAKLEQERMKATVQERQEILQQKKIEKRKKEREALSPEAQEKYDEKIAKKEARKRQNKFKIMK